MKNVFFLLPALLLCSAQLAFAQDTDQNTGDEDLAHFDIGGTVFLRQSYVGSDQTEVNVFPYIGVDNFHGIEVLGPAAKANLIEFGTGQGLGKWSVRAGPRVALDFGRDSSDSPTLEGLEDIGTSAVVGGFVRTTLSFIGLDVVAGQDVIDGHGGFVADFSVGTQYPGKGWYVQPALTLSWADEKYTQTIYGITPDQAQSSVLGAFDTSSGFHQASASVLGGFALTENWNFTALVSYRETLGDFRDSPIIQAKDGAASGIFSSLSISRRFSF